MPSETDAIGNARSGIATAEQAVGRSAPPPANDIGIDQTGYESLAGFRHHVRRFFAFSEATVAEAGLSATQYQAMLAIRAHPAGSAMSLSELADRLLIRVNSAVELVGRLVEADLVARVRSPQDRRRIELTLTALGAHVLAGLATLHFEQHRRQLPDLLEVIAGLGGVA